MDTGLLLKTRFDVVADEEDEEDEEDEYGITFLTEMVKVPYGPYIMKNNIKAGKKLLKLMTDF